MKTVLLTGFEPFGGETVNSSWLAAKQLGGRRIRGHRLVVRCLPTTYEGSLAQLLLLLRSLRPALVICVGQAAGRADVTVERVAVNIDDSRIPDNEGKNPVDLPIVPDGPVAYWSTLPIKTIVQALGSSGVPASVSNSAGTFVCNHIFYGLMHALAQSAGETKGGFIHLPLLPEQIAGGGGGRPPKAAATPPKAPDGRPSLPLETMVEALAIAVRESLRPLAACRTSSSSLLE